MSKTARQYKFGKNNPLEVEFDVSLSKLTQDDDMTGITISVTDNYLNEKGEEYGQPTTLATVDLDSLERDDGGSREYDWYTLRFTASKTDPPPEAEGQLDIEVTVGPFEGRYTPQIDDEELDEELVEAIRHAAANATSTEQSKVT
jgi:hypothetical protein